jgi:hypothetical protein
MSGRFFERAQILPGMGRDIQAGGLGRPHAFLRLYGFIEQVTVAEQDTIFMSATAIGILTKNRLKESGMAWPPFWNRSRRLLL